MRLTALILLLIGLEACAPPPYYDPALVPYIDRFKADASLYLDHRYPRTFEFDVVFGIPDIASTPSMLIIGECTGDSIIILKSYWDTAPDLMREQLMYHELGHCALGLSHVSTPSIMYPMALSYPYYYANRDRLVREEFTLPQVSVLPY